jgi:hypothetical protein
MRALILYFTLLHEINKSNPEKKLPFSPEMPSVECDIRISQSRKAREFFLRVLRRERKGETETL